MTVLYVYGTLMKGLSEPVKIKGTMFDLGWFPGVKLGGDSDFLAERIEVPDDQLGRIDRYEGCIPGDPAHSLYLRQPMLDGFIYEFNKLTDGHPVVESGDWRGYRRDLEEQANQNSRG